MVSRWLPLRWRLALASAGSVLVVATIAGGIQYRTFTGALLGRVDSQLDTFAGFAALFTGLATSSQRSDTDVAGLISVLAGGEPLLIDIVDVDGESLYTGVNAADLPATPAVRELARQGGADETYTAKVGREHVRIRARSIGDGRVLLVGRPIDDLIETRRDLVLLVIIQVLLTVGIAGLLGYWVTRSAMRPVHRLAQTAQEIAQTADLAKRVAPTSGDRDLANLTDTFNEMLDRVEGAYDRISGSLDAERRLVADASHELRTPLTTIRGNVDYLARTGADPDAVADLKTAAERLATLVAGLTTLAREDAGVKDQARPLDFDEMVRDIAAEPVHAGADIRLDLENDLWVMGSEGSLAGAVRNLIENAVKYGNGRVDVGARSEDGTVVMEVLDDGPGIAPADEDRVFERFWRAADAKGAPGSGLGLSIVRSAVESHGGDVRALPGPGGRIEVRLPACDPPAP